MIDHCRAILDFYEPVAFDPMGGFFQNFLDNGEVFDKTSRHLVSSTRFIFNYAEAFRRGYGPHYSEWATHGINYLFKHHFASQTSHFIWTVGGRSDKTAMAYGHAFVALAGATAIRAGLEPGKSCLEAAVNILERYFYEPKYKAYADERNAGLDQLSAYRGQNANMHICESLIASFHATQQRHFLDRACTLAHQFAGNLAALGGGMIWEHYTEGWEIDWEFNRDNPDDLFKPWGFQPGHQVEWAKLLTELYLITRDKWYLQRAKCLFESAINTGWDDEYGGLVYSIAPDGAFASADKYFWVQAEAIAAAYRLFKITCEAKYLDDYQRLWSYSWDHLIDHKHGGWFRLKTRTGQKIDNKKSPMGKVDYHTLGACWDVLDQMVS